MTEHRPPDATRELRKRRQRDLDFIERHGIKLDPEAHRAEIEAICPPATLGEPELRPPTESELVGMVPHHDDEDTGNDMDRMRDEIRRLRELAEDSLHREIEQWPKPWHATRVMARLELIHGRVFLAEQAREWCLKRGLLQPRCCQ